MKDSFELPVGMTHRRRLTAAGTGEKPYLWLFFLKHAVYLLPQDCSVFHAGTGVDGPT